MNIQYGWKCPQCNTVYAPAATTCSKCAPATSGYTAMGTMSVGWGNYNIPIAGVSGTIFMSPPPTLTYREQCAEQAIKDWKAGSGGWKELRTLIVKAVDEIVENETEDDDYED